MLKVTFQGKRRTRDEVLALIAFYEGLIATGEGTPNQMAKRRAFITNGHKALAKLEG